MARNIEWFVRIEFNSDGLLSDLSKYYITWGAQKMDISSVVGSYFLKSLDECGNR